MHVIKHTSLFVFHISYYSYIGGMNYAEVEEGWRCCRRNSEAGREGSDQLHLVRLKQLRLVVSSAPLMRWVQMIDGDVCESSLLSEVWWVGVLLHPQQSKLGHHGRIVDFWSCVR